jgi:hypothetical protein
VTRISDWNLDALCETGHSRRFDGRPALPVRPDQRTFSSPVGMSQTCQKRPSRRCTRISALSPNADRQRRSIDGLPVATSYGPTLSTRCPKSSGPEASRRERGSRTTAQAAPCNRPLDGWVLAISIRAGKRGEANAVQEISTGRRT